MLNKKYRVVMSLVLAVLLALNPLSALAQQPVVEEKEDMRQISTQELEKLLEDLPEAEREAFLSKLTKLESEKESDIAKRPVV